MDLVTVNSYFSRHFPGFVINVSFLITRIPRDGSGWNLPEKELLLPLFPCPILPSRCPPYCSPLDLPVILPSLLPALTEHEGYPGEGQWLRTSPLATRIENEKVFFQVIPYVSLPEVSVRLSMDVLMVRLSPLMLGGRAAGERSVDRMIFDFMVEDEGWH